MKKILKELRAERALSLREVGANLNLNYSTIACYETGKREPNIEILKRLASFYEVSLDYLCNNSDRFIYCSYKNSNKTISLDKNNYLKLKNYIYISNNKRYIDINKFLNIDENNNIIELIKEISIISTLEVLFDNKTHKLSEFDEMINKDLVVTNELLLKIKDIIK